MSCGTPTPWIYMPDSLNVWAAMCLQSVVLGLRSSEQAEKIALRLFRFVTFCEGLSPTSLPTGRVRTRLGPYGVAEKR